MNLRKLSEVLLNIYRVHIEDHNFNVIIHRASIEELSDFILDKEVVAVIPKRDENENMGSYYSIMLKW